MDEPIDEPIDEPMDAASDSTYANNNALQESSGDEQRPNPAQINHTCHFCGAGRASLHSLAMHISDLHESNSPQRTHVCSHCGARFLRQGPLTRHVRAQHESNAQSSDHVCSFCGDGFVRQGNLIRHMNDKHDSDRRRTFPFADSQNSRSPSPEVVSPARRSARLPKTKTPNSTKSAKRVMGISPETAWSPESRRAELKESASKRIQPALEPQRTIPKDSVAAQLSPKSNPQANQQKRSSKMDTVFHFFLAEECHGAIPQPLKNCETMNSFFDEALAGWGALGEEQHHLRMVAVQVIIEGVSRPIVVLWRNKEGFERMMGMVLKQAAGKQTQLNVEVRCFKK